MLGKFAGKSVSIVLRPQSITRWERLLNADSKAAAVTMSDCLAADLRSTGVHTNSILLNFIDTEANRNAMPSTDFSNAQSHPTDSVRKLSTAQVIAVEDATAARRRDLCICSLADGTERSLCHGTADVPCRNRSHTTPSRLRGASAKETVEVICFAAEMRLEELSRTLPLAIDTMHQEDSKQSAWKTR